MTPAGKTHAPVHAAEKDTMSPHDRYLLFMKALDGVREDKGTPYPCTQKDLDGYVKHYRHNSDARYLTAAEATNELCNWLNHFNEPDASSMAALERLRKGIQLKPWGPDLVIKAFKDLDIAFFKGTLLGNVRVGWEDMGYYLLGLTSPVRHAQCRIILNPRSILLSPLNGQIPFREMWRTMLHEMCHAYLMVKCGRLNDDWKGDPKKPSFAGGHGTIFRRCIHSVDRRAKRFLGLPAISSWEDYKEHS